MYHPLHFSLRCLMMFFQVLERLTSNVFSANELEKLIHY